MSASLLALFLLAAPARAGVVASVEAGAGPTSPVGPLAPIAAPVGGLGVAPIGGISLQGSLLPLLPAPVPGLLGGGALHFVGGDLSAPVQPSHQDAAATTPSKSDAPAPGRKDTPLVPGKPALGTAFRPVGHDRRKSTGVSVQDGQGSVAGALDSAAQTAADASAADGVSGATAEKAAGFGRRFFDRSSDESRGLIEGTYAVLPSVSGTVADGSYAHALGAGTGLKAASTPSPADALGWGHGAAFNTDGDLKDAVGAVPSPSVPAALTPASLGGSFVPGGDRGAAHRPFGAASTPESVVPFGSGAFGTTPTAPKPLALDLSGSGLVVRVSALVGGAQIQAAALSAAPPAAAAAPSTAWLERGGLLEAMGVAEDYAGTGLQSASTKTRAALAASVPAAVAPRKSAAPSWLWLWALVPLFAFALRLRL